MTLKQWAKSLTNNTYALYLASKDRRVPVLTKVIIGIVIAYALSPIDLIPDFIPFLGYLDDIILLPLGIWLSIKLLPKDVWEECQMIAEKQSSEMQKSNKAAVVIVIIWLVLITGFITCVWLLVVQGERSYTC